MAKEQRLEIEARRVRRGDEIWVYGFQEVLKAEKFHLDNGGSEIELTLGRPRFDTTQPTSVSYSPTELVQIRRSRARA